MAEVLKGADSPISATSAAGAHFRRDDGIKGLDFRDHCIAQIEWPDSQERLDAALLLALELLRR